VLVIQKSARRGSFGEGMRPSNYTLGHEYKGSYTQKCTYGRTQKCTYGNTLIWDDLAGPCSQGVLSATLRLCCVWSCGAGSLVAVAAAAPLLPCNPPDPPPPSQTQPPRPTCL